MDWKNLADALFPHGHAITETDQLLSGSAQLGGQAIAVVGTTGHVPIGVEIALAQARFILQTVREHPRRPILILVDTVGQCLRRRDEMLGIHSYMAHLGKCVDFARRSKHQVLGLVYDQAQSGGFVTSGLMADVCYALPDATIRVMALPAMARITRVPQERLVDLSATNPVFAPGAKNFLRMGAIQEIWNGDLAACLESALGFEHAGDDRDALGLARGGRKCAAPVAAAIVAGDDLSASGPGG
jgi:malonate decarboxylase gamma subunit